MPAALAHWRLSARLWLACTALVLLAACTTQEAVYVSVQSDHLRNRPIIVIDSLPQPPLNEVQQRAIVSRMQQRLMTLPYLGTSISPQQFLEHTEGNYSLRNDYQTYVDTLSSVGVSDRELALKLGAATGSDLLMNVQAYYAPCSFCQDGGSAYLVTQFIEAKTGLLLLRVDERNHPAPSDQAIGEAFLTLEQDTVAAMLKVLTPRSHIQRFLNLKRLHEKPNAEKS
jgi:hypothetical protein